MKHDPPRQETAPARSPANKQETKPKRTFPPFVLAVGFVVTLACIAAGFFLAPRLFPAGKAEANRTTVREEETVVAQATPVDKTPAPQAAEPTSKGPSAEVEVPDDARYRLPDLRIPDEQGKPAPRVKEPQTKSPQEKNSDANESKNSPPEIKEVNAARESRTEVASRAEPTTGRAPPEVKEVNSPKDSKNEVAPKSEPAASAAPDDAAAELKKLEGNWKLIRSESRGNVYPADFQKEGIFFEGDKIVWTVDGKAVGQKGTVTIDASTTPRSIDVEITRGSFIGKKLLGIYELKDGKLTICWSEPDGEKRPKKFVTKTAIGAGSQMDTYLSPEAEQAAAANKDESSKDLKKLEGNWKLTRQEFKGNLWPSGFRKEGLFIEGSKISWTEDGKAFGQTGNLTIDSRASPPTIDVEITRGSDIGKKLLGIYELKGNKLTICWSEAGGEKRPTKFVTRTAIGAGTLLGTYEAVDGDRAAGDKKPAEANKGESAGSAADAKKLEGNWKLTRHESRGNLRPVEGRKLGIFIEAGKISWTEDGKAFGQTGNWTIDPSTNPPSIDVEITRGSDIGKKLLGIYELKNGKLTICWSEPGGEKRPTKFVTKTALGAGVNLDTFQFADDDKATGGKNASEPKNGDNQGNAAEAKKLEGNWKLIRKEFMGNLWPEPLTVKNGLFIEGNKIFWTQDRKERGGQRGDLAVDASTTPPSIDVEITRGSSIGKKLLAIYEIKGDRLTICWSEPGGEKRPTKFVTKTAVGAGTMLETYQKLKD